MNQKIPLRRLAEALAVRLTVTPEEAEETLKLFFSHISDTLRTGSSVKIKGFGEFTLTSDLSDPVAFIPDRTWADEVNAPFAMFSEVAVTPGLDDKDFNDVGFIEPQPEPEAAPVAEPDPVAEPAPVLEPTPAPEPEPAAEPIPDVEPIPDAEPEPTHMPEPAPAPLRKEPLRWPDEEEEEEEKTDRMTDTESEIEAEMPQDIRRSSFRSGFIVGLIIGLAIGALALCAYVLYYVNAQEAPQSVETELVESEVLPAN